jgi:hypothetical protein
MKRYCQRPSASRQSLRSIETRSFMRYFIGDELLAPLTQQLKPCLALTGALRMHCSSASDAAFSLRFHQGERLFYFSARLSAFARQLAAASHSTMKGVLTADARIAAPAAPRACPPPPPALRPPPPPPHPRLASAVARRARKSDPIDFAFICSGACASPLRFKRAFAEEHRK